jgi:hypothetical protein
VIFYVAEVKKEAKSRRDRRTSRPKGRTRLLSSCDCFFFHNANEILERGLYDDAIKPGSIVVDETDFVDDGVLEFSFFIDEVSL